MVFGFVVEGHFFLEGFLLVVILFLVTQKSYKPPKKPLSEKVSNVMSFHVSSVTFLFALHTLKCLILRVFVSWFCIWDLPFLYVIIIVVRN